MEESRWNRNLFTAVLLARWKECIEEDTVQLEDIPLSSSLCLG